MASFVVLATHCPRLEVATATLDMNFRVVRVLAISIATTRTGLWHRARGVQFKYHI